MVTINPADVQPGEVWLVAAPEGHTGAWIGVRCEPEDDSCYPWRLVRTEGNGTTVYRQDSDVTLLDRLAPVRPVTRGDLPTTVELVESWGGGGLQALAAHVLDVVVDRLNGCGGVPAVRRYGDVVVGGVPAPHELVGALRERDEARDERDKWEEKYLDTDEALHEARAERDEAVARAEAAEIKRQESSKWSSQYFETYWRSQGIEAERDEAERERDVARHERDTWRDSAECVAAERDEVREQLREAETRLAKCMADFQDVEDERDEAVARAEAAEARTAPAVTKRELRSVVGAHDPGDDELAVSRVNALTDRLWSLVSGADPAVFVVRESDVSAVEVRRASDGWYADGAWLASADETAEWVRDRAAEMVVCAARNEAVARAIEAEQATDPLLDKAQEFAALADWELTDREAELLHKVAAHVLGQEGRHVDQ